MKKRTLFKSVLLLLTSISIPAISFAQSNKGDWAVGAGIGDFYYFSDQSINSRNGATFRFNLGPNLGYFFTRDLVLGAGLNFNYTKQWSGNRSNPFYKSTNGTVGLSPFVRYYLPLKNLTNRFYAQIDCGTSTYFLTRSQSLSYDMNGLQNGLSETIYSSQPGFVAAARLGFQRTISTNVAFNTSLGYSYYRTKVTWYTHTVDGLGQSRESSPTNDIVINSNLFWTIGLTIFLHRD